MNSEEPGPAGIVPAPAEPEPVGRDKNLLLVKICAAAGAVAAIAGVVVGCGVPVIAVPPLPRLPENLPSILNMPTNLPTGLPTNLPPGFPTELPSIPTMPNMPAPPGGW
jgi:hypothetical protein